MLPSPEEPEPRELARGAGAATPYARRAIHYRKGRYDAAVFHRRDIMAGQRLEGPAVVEQDDTTTLIPAGFMGAVDPFGHIVIQES